MRSYIFTPIERKAIENLLAKRIKISDSSIRMVLSRVRTFEELAKDIDLYDKIRKTVTTASA
jgi:hypothetical protein